MSSAAWKRLDYVPLDIQRTRFAPAWDFTPP